MGWLLVKQCLQMLLIQASRCPGPRSTELRHRTQTSIDPSTIDSCIIHKAKNIFCEGKYSPRQATDFYKSKSSSLLGNFHHAAPYWTPPKSRCRSSRRESCPRLGARIDLNSLDNFHLQRQNSAFVHSETQNTPQFFEGCC